MRSIMKSTIRPRIRSLITPHTNVDSNLKTTPEVIPTSTSFPQVPQARRLLYGLYDLLEDLDVNPPTSQGVHVAADPLPNHLPDSDSLFGLPWYEDDDLKREFVWSQDYLELGNDDQTMEGLNLSRRQEVLATTDAYERILSCDDLIAQVLEALQLWVQCSRDSILSRMKRRRELVSMSKTLQEMCASCDTLLLMNHDYSCSMYILNKSIQIILELIMFSTSVTDHEISPPIASQHPAVYGLAYLARSLAYRLWIRWGWYTSDREIQHRDLYLAIDLIEESLLQDQQVSSDASHMVSCLRILRLSQLYRLAYKYSGTVADLHNALQAGTKGLQMLLHTPEETVHADPDSGEALQLQILAAKWDLSRILDQISVVESSDTHLNTAWKLAREAYNQSLHSLRHRLSTELIERVTLNYRYLKDKLYPTNSILLQLPSLDGLTRVNSAHVLEMLALLMENRGRFSTRSGKARLDDVNSLMRQLTQQQEILGDEADATRSREMTLIESLGLYHLYQPPQKLRPYQRVIRLLSGSKGLSHQTLALNEGLAWRMVGILGKRLEAGHLSLPELVRVRQILKYYQVCKTFKHRALFPVVFAKLYRRTRDMQDCEAAIEAFESLQYSFKDSEGVLACLSRIPELYSERFRQTGDREVLDGYLKNIVHKAREYLMGLESQARRMPTCSSVHGCIVGESQEKCINCRRSVAFGSVISTAILAKLSLGDDYAANGLVGALIAIFPELVPDGSLARNLRRSIISSGLLVCNTRETCALELQFLEESELGARVDNGMTLLRHMVEGILPTEWHEEYQRGLRVLFALIPFIFNLESTLYERNMYRDSQGQNILDFLVRASAFILEYGGSPSEALEFLEMSRGTILRNVIGYRADLINLRNSHPQLATKLQELMHRLDETFAQEPQRPSIDFSKEAWMVNLVQLGNRSQDMQRMKELLSEIHEIPGYETFMVQSYPGAEFAKRAASRGPIVVVSAWRRGHAILITPEEVTSLWLPGLTEEEAKRQMGVLGELKKCFFIDTAQKQFRDMLGWLWDAVVEPILNQLGFYKVSVRARQPKQKSKSSAASTSKVAEIDSVLRLPRIWWIGVGTMAQAPFHAAGRYPANHQSKARYTAQHCVSSYTPTIQALVFSRRGEDHKPVSETINNAGINHDDPSKVFVTTDDSANLNERYHADQCKIHKVLVVTMATTPEHEDKNDPSPTRMRNEAFSPLDVAAELNNIQEASQAAGSHHVATLTSPEAGDVLFALPFFNIIHFACHGLANSIDPLRSCLVLQKQGGSEGDSNTSQVVRDYLSVHSMLKVRGEISGSPCSPQNRLRLVYLSACSSASNRCTGMSDEPLHIASVFQLANFNHAIGTSWDSEDDVCVEVARNFYKYLFEFQNWTSSKGKGKGKMGDDKANDQQVPGVGPAEALHLAVDAVRKKHWRAPWLWGTFVHWGA